MGAAVTCVFYSAFIQHGNHGRPSHGSLTAESDGWVTHTGTDFPLKLSLDNWVDYNLAEAAKAMWSCPRERGRGALVMQCFFPIWDPYWSNLTFGWWASWGVPNVLHFHTNYESESRAASHKTTNNFLFPIKTHSKMSRGNHQKHVCVFVSERSTLAKAVTFIQA